VEQMIPGIHRKNIYRPESRVIFTVGILPYPPP
jgi:hypothetical protein